MAQTRQEKLNDYEGFVEKFKPKLTTDDCYTPQLVYEAIKAWACEQYNIDPAKVVRPFYPGGDYKNFDYSNGAVVVDNPPFSILSEIIKFYISSGIQFFIFAPALVTMNYVPYDGANIIFTYGVIEYENGAQVKTNFITSFGEYKVAAEPTLCEVIKKAVKETSKRENKTLSKHVYPLLVMRSTDFENLANKGQAFRLKSSEISFTRALDNQRPVKKAIYGSGILISEQAAMERAVAEKEAARYAAATAAEWAAAEYAETEHWQLSAREWEIIKSLER